MWLLVLSTARAACLRPVPAADLDAPLAAADDAVAALDAAALDHALRDAREVLACVVEVPSPAAVSHYFGLVGISAYVAGRTEEAIDAFAVPRASAAWSLPQDISGPLRELWEGVDPAKTEGTRPLAPVPSASWAVDGVPSTDAPTARPFLLQEVGAAGAVDATWLLASHAALPAAALPPPVAPAPTAPAPAPAATSERGHASRALLLSALGAGALGAGAAAGAGVAQHEYLQSTEPDDALGGLVGANQVLGYSAIGLLAVGGGLGASAVLVGRW